MYIDSPGSQPSSSPRVESVDSEKAAQVQNTRQLAAEVHRPLKKPRIEG